jgi:Tfp pilus assembly protein PilF
MSRSTWSVKDRAAGGGRPGAALIVAALGAALAFAAGAASTPPGGAIDDAIRANNRGAALMEQFKHAQAAEEFLKVTKGAPSWAPGFVNLGLAYFYNRDNDKAEAAFREAVRLDPALVQAHYGLGMLLKNLGNAGEAIAALDKAGALDPEDADLLYNLGLLHARRREFGEAIALLQRARQIDPNSMSIRYQLARALIQSGQSKAGEKEMAAYQKLSANPRFAVPTGTQYGEAGRYALVLTDYTVLGGPSAPPAPVAIRFSDATEGSGIAFAPGDPGGDTIPAAPAQGESVQAWAARYGSGVAVADLDGDGLLDLLFSDAGTQGTPHPVLYRNGGNWRFEDITGRSGLAAAGIQPGGIGMAAAVADYDNDHDPDIFITRLGQGVLLQNEAGVFRDVTGQAGAKVSGLLLGASWGDVDHDGDLDLCVTRLRSPGPAAGRTPPAGRDAAGPAAASGGVVLLLNLGNGSFRDGTAELGFKAPPEGAVGASFSDIDGDRDTDAVLSSAGGPDALLDNRRDAGFADRGKAAGLAARGEGRGVVIGDVNDDGFPDLVFAAGPAGANRLYLNDRRGAFTARDLPRPRGASSWGAALFDADNDGDLDLFFTGSVNLLLLNDGRGNFKDATADAGLNQIAVRAGRAAAAADLDGDGDMDVVVTQNGGHPLLLRNEGGNRNKWLEVRTAGLNSNRDGIGTRVDVQSGPYWQRQEIQAGGGYLSQGPPLAHFGMGGRGVADFVRLLWPGGVLQAELEVPAGQRTEQAELDRKGSSCPLLFAWNGGRFGFVTDFLGVGGLGMWMAPGVYGTPDPDEFVKIEPSQLQPRDGAYLFQVMENLEEISYLDEARLIVLDHPAGIEVYPNEAFGAKAPPEERVYAIATADRVFPVKARDHHDREVTDAVLKIDRRYPDDFALNRLAGYAEMHHLTLEFPEAVTRMQHPVLFLYGWVDYEYASTNYAAHQAGLSLQPPILEMENEDGVFAPVIDSIGFPAGMPRMMTVDLNALAPLKTRALRLRTNMRVYYDQVFIAEPLADAAAAEKVVRNEVKPSVAHLHRRGFPREHSPDGREPKLYDYNIIDNTQPFKVMTGSYTRFGRVTDLLTATDDRFVIFGKAEEITLEFPVKGLPVVKKGFKRSFILYASGYCKDMDPHTAFGDTVEPLPFHGMSGYPYRDDESYPQDTFHQEYLKTYNTRRLEGR